MVGAAWRDEAGRWDRRAAQATARLLVLPLVAWTVVGCAPHKRTNPDYCDPAASIDSCASRGKICDLARFRCVSPDAGTDDGADARRDATPPPPDSSAPDSSAPDNAMPDGSAPDLSGDAARDVTAAEKVPSCPMCSGSTPICNTTTGACAGCTSSAQCAAATPGTPLCATTGGTCVVCNADSDCRLLSMATPLCLDMRQCVACRANADCPMPAPVCDANHSCGACKLDGECAGRAGTPVCRVDNGVCVECVKHTDCKSPTKPACGPGNVCTACTSDQQCVEKQGSPNPGVCMFHADGRCATDAEVLYVKPVPGCAMAAGAGTGTATTPFCTTQTALTAVSPTKAVVVIRPGTAGITLAPWAYSAPAGVGELTVVGQEGATVGPGTDIGVTLSSGTLYLRGLRISGMLDEGIYVAPGNNTLRMNRCIVVGNKGGLFINGAGFDIANSVFANNGLATIDNPNGPPIEYGGVYLGGVPTRPGVFRYNTVYGNGGPGLVCGGTYLVKGVLVAANMTAEVVMCNVDPTTSDVPGTNTVYDPRFDTTDPNNPYRLTARSPCVNRGTSMNQSPPDDIDGNPRPSPVGGISDCGAHELQQAQP